MAKVTSYICTNCKSIQRSKLGKCPDCGEFGTLVVDESRSVSTSTGAKKVGTKSSSTVEIPSTPATLMRDISAEETVRYSTGLGELDRVLGGGIVKGSVMLLAGEPGVGKALAISTPIATTSGWSTMGELSVGDEVFGDDGLPTRIVAVSEVWENRPVYEVVFSDGSTLVADENHEWSVSSRRQRLNAVKNSGLRSSILTTKEISEQVLYGTSDRLNYSIEHAKALNLSEVELPIEPYALGAWLGDGNSSGPNLTSFDPEIVEAIQSTGRTEATRLPYGKNVFKLSVPKPENWGVKADKCWGCDNEFHRSTINRPRKSTGYCKECQYGTLSFRGRLRNLGVLDNKHIPTAYLRASEGQRRELLMGILDTDGHVDKRGIIQLGLTNRALSYDCLELIRSLGYRVNMTKKTVNGKSEESSTCYIMNFTTTDPVFKLTRKLKRQSTVLRKTAGRRYIKEVRRIESVPVRCIEVSNESHLFLAGKELIPTHNSSILALVAHKASLKEPVLYVSGEESKHQIKLRHQRMNAEGDKLYLASENDLMKVLGHMDAVNPSLMIVDSLQTIASPDIDGTAGSPSQVKEVATILTREAKDRNIPLIFVGHFTKDAQIAGPRVVEHLVDVVLAFEGQEDSTLRMLRGVKNRFGPSDEVGCFEHTETGLDEVPDPSGLLLDSRDEKVSGVATSIFLEGKRALPVEVQALVTSTVLPNPRKNTIGLQHPRSIMLQAILQKHASQRLGDKDVYISTIGNIQVKEPAVDLATVMALVTANKGFVSRNDSVAIGEVTLSGRIKKVPGIQRRLTEAQRLGFTTAYVPIGTRDMVKNIDIKLVEVKDVFMAATFAQAFSESEGGMGD